MVVEQASRCTAAREEDSCCDPENWICWERTASLEATDSLSESSESGVAWEFLRDIWSDDQRAMGHGPWAMKNDIPFAAAKSEEGQCKHGGERAGRSR